MQKLIASLVHTGTRDAISPLVTYTEVKLQVWTVTYANLNTSTLDNTLRSSHNICMAVPTCKLS